MGTTGEQRGYPDFLERARQSLLIDRPGQNPPPGVSAPTSGRGLPVTLRGQRSHHAGRRPQPPTNEWEGHGQRRPSGASAGPLQTCPRPRASSAKLGYHLTALR